MIDLHCHLDGSLSVRDVLTLSNMTGETLPTTEERVLFSLLTFDKVGTLNEYLTKFDLPIRLLRSGECMEYAVRSVAERLASCGCTYAELRFAPALHMMGGATMREIVQGAIKGRKGAAIPINLILCAIRGREEKENVSVIEIAAEEKGKGVVGVDLAGAEALYPTENYKSVFDLAYRSGLNITIHAGEASGADSVRAALDFGARRIGHGVAAIRDDRLIDRIIRDDIALEVCPTSNVQTGAVPSLTANPLPKFLEKGVSCVICSDNMTVSNTDVRQEYEKVKQAFPSQRAAIDRAVEIAGEYAFGSVNE